MKIFEVTENISHTSKRLRDIEQERDVKIGSDEWFKLWFSLPYLKEAKETIYDILEPEDCGPFDGGCVLVAQALQKIHGGDIVVLINDRGNADHAAVKIGNTLLDFDGPLPVDQFIKRFEKNEHVKVKGVRPMEPNDLPEATRNQSLLPKIVDLLSRKKSKRVTESLDQPYPYRWSVQSEDEWAARARTDSGAILDIRFEYGSWDAQWDIEFLLDDGYKATAAGDQFRIFATVVKAIKEWWKSTSAEGIPVKTITFSADKLNNQTGKTGSRERLYSRFAQQFANSIGFTVQSGDNTDATKFELINPNYSKRKFNEAVESGKEMLKIFRDMHHDAGMNKDMDRYIRSHDWQLGNFTPDMFPSEEEFFDYDDPFDRVIDIDYSHRVNLAAPIIAGPQYSDGKYSVIDGNHRAATAQKMGKTIQAYFPVAKTNENFADGKNPGRKGLAKRVGVNTKASVSDLRKTAKNSSGEKQRMAHWLANMKAGKAKTK